MYPCIKCQSIWRTSDFGTKFNYKNMNDKNFEKININLPVPNFSQFRELQFLRPYCPKNTLGWSIRTNAT